MSYLDLGVIGIVGVVLFAGVLVALFRAAVLDGRYNDAQRRRCECQHARREPLAQPMRWPASTRQRRSGQPAIAR